MKATAMVLLMAGALLAGCAAPYDLDGVASVLRIPVLHRDASVFFTPPAWNHEGEDISGEP